MKNINQVLLLKEKVIQNGGLAQVNYEGLDVDIYLNNEKKSDYLFICFSGAKPLEKDIPYFNRWKWSNVFHSSILAISDYTFNLSKELQIGWYQNDGDSKIFEKLASIIRLLANQLGYDESKVILYGSSAGGFAALKCANYLSLAKCIAINPQTDVVKYYKTYYEALIKYAKKITRSSEVVDGNLSNVLLVQNELDVFHMKKHFLPLLNKNPSIAHYIYTHENGHGAEPKEIITHIILKSLKNDCHLGKLDEDITLNKLEIINISKDNSVSEEYIDFLPQGRKDIKPYRIHYPIDWNMDPLKDKNWKFQLNMWRFLDGNLQRYSDTKNMDYIIPIRKAVQAWYDFHFIENRKNDFLAEDMAIGGRAMRLAYYIVSDRVYIESNPKFKEIISKIVNQHLILLTDINKIAYSNHTLTDMHGLMAISHLVTPYVKSLIFDFIDFIFPKLVSMQFSQDGFHKENSPEYHFFAIKCFSALKASKWFEKYKLSEILDKANENRKIFYMPDGRILPFGDSSNLEREDREIAFYQQKETEIFNEAGYFVFRKNCEKNLIRNSSFFSIMAGLRSRFHKQNDDLSFIWYEGEDIIRDFGKFAYKRDQFRNYAVSSESHNSLKFNNCNMYKGNLIDEDQYFESAIRSYDYDNKMLKIEAGVKYKSKNIPEVNRNIEHCRSFEYLPNNSMIVTDKINSASARVEQFFHFGRQWVLQEVNGNSIILRSEFSGRKLKIKVDKRTNFKIYHGSLSPLQGWSCVKYAYSVPSLSLVLVWAESQSDCKNQFYIN